MAYSLVAGDLGTPMLIVLVAPGAQSALATAQSLQLRWQKPDGTVSVVPLILVDASTWQIKRVWSAGDTDQVGEHRGQVIVTDVNGLPVTDPNEGDTLVWSIYPQL
jgi:hypothetical protein